jgi:hypothetical protein
MRILGNSLIVCVLLLTAACGSLAPGSTRYQTEANANQYVGDNIQTVVQARFLLLCLSDQNADARKSNAKQL